MIRIISTNETSKSAKSRKSGEAAKPFAASSSAAKPAGGAALEAAASPSALSALIALQSRSNGSARSYIAAQQTLDALADLHRALVLGDGGAAALDRLGALSERLADVATDDRLAGVAAEIRVRAAVELAKRSKARAVKDAPAPSTKP